MICFKLSKQSVSSCRGLNTVHVFRGLFSWPEFSRQNFLLVYSPLCLKAVKNFMDKTSPKTFDVLLSSTHDIVWNQGPFGEVFGSYGFAFLGSVCCHESVSMVDAEELAAPLPNEPSVSIDWNLPMSEDAQILFFQRVKSMFDRMTKNLPAHKKNLPADW